MKKVTVTEAFIHGAVSVEKTSDGLRPWRIPFDQHDLFNIDEGLGNAGKAAGVRIRFKTTARTFSLIATGGCQFDLVIDNHLVSTVCREDLEGSLDFALPEHIPHGENVLEIWLPQMSPVWLDTLVFKEGETGAAAPDDRLKWVTYGSSITHCGAAHSPARTWPALAARLKNLHLTCLGYGGQCHLDGMVARMIRDLDADIITIKCGINIYGAATLSPRSFRPALISAVQTIRDRHPATPIGVVSPVISPPRETKLNAVGYNLKMMRGHVSDAVDLLKRAGDTNLYYFDGLDIFGENNVDFLPDDLHPNGDGYEILGRNFARIVLNKLIG
ncbi:MAG: SGNH/GDSL hydrolase family protein [Lentisphaeria bacterium]|nr:SGNH/GDSL hydrolase family protein [Lentisphaeria bacterium]